MSSTKKKREQATGVQQQPQQQDPKPAGQTVKLKNRMNQLLMFNIIKRDGTMVGVELASLASLEWPKLPAGYGPDVSRLLKRGHLIIES